MEGSRVKKRLYVDSANIEEIRRALATGAVSGVTTNPSLMAKEAKGDYLKKLEEIAVELSFLVWRDSVEHLSVEVTTLDPGKMADQAFELNERLSSRLASTFVQLFVKIPIGFEYLRVMNEVNKFGFVNATAAMTARQALLAERAGAAVVSFFYNRMIDGGDENGRGEGPGYARRRALDEIAKFARLREITENDEKEPCCEIICGSIRRPEDVLECWEAGADIVTAPLRVVEKMVEHPKTTEAIERFQKDIEQWQS